MTLTVSGGKRIAAVLEHDVMSLLAHRIVIDRRRMTCSFADTLTGVATIAAGNRHGVRHVDSLCATGSDGEQVVSD